MDDLDDPDVPASPIGPERPTFVLRLSRERRLCAPWRGEVEYLQSGQRRAARNPAVALAHIAQWLLGPGAPDAVPDAGGDKPAG